MVSLRVASLGLLLALLSASLARPATVLAGTILEVRLRSAVGSRASHPGDPVCASVVAPVSSGADRLMLQGAILQGTVTDSVAIGLGVKHQAAILDIHFDSIRLANGLEVPLAAKVVGIETARERVDEAGRVVGIAPAANLSSAVSLLISTGLFQAGLVPPAILFKFLAVRSPDPEIVFPRGTELLARLTQDVTFSGDELTASDIEQVPESQMAQVKSTLSALPLQQAEMKHQRAADPVNLALIGTPQQVQSAFRAAGWSGEGPHSALSLYRLYKCMVQRMGYTTAPMSRLKLNGVLPSDAYQKSLDTISRRHHVRLWRQGNTNVWFGAATEDIGLTVREMHVTHLVDGQVDNERAKVADDLWFAGCVEGASAMARPMFAPRSDKGVVLDTDGVLAVLRLKDCSKDANFDKQADSRVSRFRLAWHALARDTMRANPLTVGLVLARSFPHWTGANTASFAPLQGFRRPSIVN